MNTNNILIAIAIFMAFIAGIFCSRLEDEQAKNLALNSQIAVMQSATHTIGSGDNVDLAVDAISFNFEPMHVIGIETKPEVMFVGPTETSTEEKETLFPDGSAEAVSKKADSDFPEESDEKVLAKVDTETEDAEEQKILYTIPDYDPETHDRAPLVKSAKEVYDILSEGGVNYVGNVASEMVPVKAAIHRRFEMIPKEKLLGKLRYVSMTTREILHWSDKTHYSPVGPKIFRDGVVMLDLNTRGDKSRGIEGSAYGPSQFIDVSRKVVFSQNERLPYSTEDLELIQSTEILGRYFHGDVELGYKAWEIYMYLVTTGDSFEKKALDNGYDPLDPSVRIACWNGGVRGFFDLGYAKGYRKAFKTNYAMLSERWEITPQPELIAVNTK